MAAQPEIEKRVEKMVANHRWVPAGYKACALNRAIYAVLIPSTGEVRRPFCVVDNASKLRLRYGPCVFYYSSRSQALRTMHISLGKFEL